jgi:hypothetical protein
VRARTAELPDAQLRASHDALLALTVKLRKDATRDADWDWLEVAAGGVFGGEEWSDDLAEEAVFGDDPEALAEAITTDVLRALAIAHRDHPEYESGWQARRT